jgi:hypothetical protein
MYLVWASMYVILTGPMVPVSSPLAKADSVSPGFMVSFLIAISGIPVKPLACVCVRASTALGLICVLV